MTEFFRAFRDPIQYHSDHQFTRANDVYSNALVTWFAEFGWPPAPPSPSANELAFRELEIQPGDLVRLVPRGEGGAVLEGEIVQIKTVNAGTESQLRIKGFDETPHGNHNVYFGVENHEVELLERPYQWTPLDRAIAIWTRLEDNWPDFTEEVREIYRDAYGPRIARLKEVLVG